MTKNKTKMGATAFRLCTNNWPKIAVIPDDSGEINESNTARIIPIAI